MTPDLDLSAINDFLTFGLVAPGSSFFRVSQRKKIGFPEKFPDTTTINDVAGAAEKVHSLLLSSLEYIFRHQKPDSLALSGGADSRILLLLLSEHFKKELRQLRLYTRVHPALTADSDRDACIALMITRHLGLSCEVERPSFHPRAYLYPHTSTQKLALSALWGGELLGGQVLSISPFQWNDFSQEKEASPLKEFCLSRLKSSEKRVHFQVQFLSELFWNAPLTALYKSHLWLSPLSILKYTVSPFLTPIFTEGIRNINSCLLENYFLQKHYLERYGSSLEEFDINNPQIRERPKNLKIQRTVEPKDLPLGQSSRLKKLTPGQLRLLKVIEHKKEKRYFSFLKSHLHLISSTISH